MAFKIDEIIAAASLLTEKPSLTVPPLPKEEAWPADALLYQPLEMQQILLPEYASSLAVQTYLRMCHLPYEERSCANAEFMSPGGRLTRLPLLRIGRRLLAEFEPIVEHVEQTQPKQALTSWLDEEQREQLATMVTHVENTCTLAELHSCFCNLNTYEEHTWLRNGATYPWPLSMLRRYDRRQDALRILRVYGWHQLDEAGVQQQLRKCLQLVMEMLQEAEKEQGEAMFLWGKQPTQLDALLFGHMGAVLGTKLPQVHLAHTMREFPRLVDICRRIDAEYFEGKLMNGEKLEENLDDDWEIQEGKDMKEDDKLQKELNSPL